MLLDPAVAANQTSAPAHHSLRRAAHQIVRDSEWLLADPATQARRLWRDALGESLLGGLALRAAIEGWNRNPAVATGDGPIAELVAQLREPQRRIVEAMTSILGLVGTDPEDEFRFADVRAIREAALSLNAGDPSAVNAITDGADVRAEPDADDVSGPRRRPTVLIVDDSESVRRMLVALVEKAGYETVQAENGFEAIGLADTQQVDLVLSDIEMPGMDGFALLSALKASPVHRRIPVIMVSGLHEAAIVVRCIEGGADDHVAKPFNQVILRARMHASLERGRLRREEIAHLSRVASLTAAAQSWRAREAEFEMQLRQLRRDVGRSRSSIAMTAIPATANTLPTGHVLAGRYELLNEIGRGGMGVVYRARDRQLHDDVAVKVIRKELSGDTVLIERLRSESRLARRITHRNVVRSHDLGESEGVHFLTMELVEGITIESLLATSGRLSVPSTMAIAGQLAAALVVAHGQGVMHRDIKPANLLVDGDGLLKVMDFGLARLVESGGDLTLSGTLVGTPRYFAPEQLLGGVLDARTDLFSVGIVLYECLTGAGPFEATSPLAIAARMIDGPPIPILTLVPSVPAKFAAVVEQLLRYEPAERVQSAQELETLLRDAA